MKKTRARIIGSSITKVLLAISLVAGQILAMPQIVHASTVDTCTWIGTTGVAATASNWSCSTDGTEVPSAGDSVVFPNSATTKTVVIDGIASLKDISITGSGYDFTRTDGTVIALAGSGVSIETTQDATFDVPVTLGNGTLENMTLRASTGKTLLMNGAVALDTGAGEINIGTSGQTGGVNFVGNVTGTTSQFIGTNGATVRLAGAANTFTAATVGAESLGYFDCSNVSCFGNAANHIYTGGGTVVINVGGLLTPYAQAFETSSPPIPASPSVLEINASNVTFSSAMTLNDNLSITVDAAKSFLPGGTIALGTHTLTYTTASGGQVQQNNVISGTGGNLVVDGYVQMNNNNTYTGTTLITPNGRLISSVAQGMGTTAGGTTIQNGGTLQYNPFANIVDAENITVVGAGSTWPAAIELFSADKNVELSGSITLTGDTTVALVAPTPTFPDPVIVGNLTFSGKITGTGSLTLVGADATNGQFTFAGTTANDYTGATTLTGAVLTLNGTDNVVSVPHNINVNSTPTSASQLVEYANEQIADNAVVALNNDTNAAIFNMQTGITETVGMITGDGIINLPLTADVLKVGGGNTSGTFSGIITSQSGTIQKIGSGTWTLTGNNAVESGQWVNYDVAAGKLLANFYDTSGQFTPFSVSGGVLGGHDVIGPTTVSSGSLSPGNSPGCINPSGTLSFASGSTLTIEITGATICTQYDKVAASGAVILGGATLNVNLSYASTTGTVFTIVEGSTVSGTFAGLANGATFTANGRTLRINYASGSVTLTDVGAATSASLANTGAVMPATLLYALSGSSLLGIFEVLRRSRFIRYKAVR